MINVFNGDTISCLVTEDTEIECENDDDDEPDEIEDGTDEDVDDDLEDEAGEDVDDGPGHERGDHSDDDEDSSGPGSGGDDEDCSIDALTPGATVSEAELDLIADGLVFDEIELR